MKKVKNKSRRAGVIALIACALVCAGCEGLRFAASEKQRLNAWLHNRTTSAAAETAKNENASEKLQALTELSELQSRAFVSYNGLPNTVSPPNRP